LATLLYLDDDDEITSAAARIRSTDEGPIALVVPHGSRLSTSRINFRLLAREAQSRGRRLAIVAGDGATRALAASAGLPVFGSVGEYEESVAGRAADAAASETEEPAAPKPRAARRTAAGGRVPPDPDATVVVPVVPAVISAANRSMPPPPRVPAESISRPAAVLAPPRAPAIDRDRPRVGRTAGIVALALVALAVVVGGVAAYLLLPSASIVVSPRQEPIGPVSLSVRADPSAVVADPAAGVVPAQRLTFDLSASDTFPVEGKRVAETKATGRVTFRSYNTAAPNTIPAGSIVSTEGGIQFRTTVSARLGRARVIPPSRIVPSSASVAVEAVKAGIAGNVPANAIIVVPRGEDPLVTNVRNAEPTDGGTHQEFPLVEQADVDAATGQLTKELDGDFQTLLADPASAPTGTTLFPETSSLTEPTFSVDPATLVGQEIESFDLEATSTGGVTSVDQTSVTALAADVMAANVAADHRLVDGSVDARIDPPTAAGEIVTFPVSARAAQVMVIEPRTLVEKIKGRPIFQARSILAPYGDVQISVWPDWVTSIPTIDGRIDLRLAGAGSPSSASPSPTAGP
jgi:hypothetical protein